MKPSDFKQHLKILLYGPPKVGKTYFCGTATEDPRIKKILILCLDDGAVTLADFDEARIDVIVMDGTEKTLDAALQFAKAEHYDLVVLDHITDLDKNLMLRTLAKTFADSKASGDPSKLRDPDLPQLDHYGRQGVALLRYVRKVRDLPCHVIVIAQRREDEVKKGSDPRVMKRPALTGQSSMFIPSMFDLVLHIATNRTYDRATKQQGVERILTLDGDDTLLAGVRKKGLPARIKDPTFKKLLDLFGASVSSRLPHPQTALDVKMAEMQESVLSDSPEASVPEDESPQSE